MTLLPIIDLGHSSVFFILYTAGSLLGWEISPTQGLYLHTEQHKHGINAHKHQCFVRDSNP
jgi:hypothetical protein